MELGHGVSSRCNLRLRTYLPHVEQLPDKDDFGYDDNDLDNFEIANDLEGDEDFADDISTNEFDGADDPNFDNVQHTRDTRRNIYIYYCCPEQARQDLWL